MTRPTRRQRTGVLIAVLATVLCVLAGLTALVVRAGADPTADAGGDPVQSYRAQLAPALLARKEEIDGIARDIDADASADRRADRYRAEVAPRIDALVVDAVAYRAPTAPLAATHEHAVAALRLAQQAYDETARSYGDGGDTSLLASARHHTDVEAVRWRQWIDALLAL